MLLLGRHQRVQRDQLEVLAGLVQADVQLGDVAPARQEDQDGTIAMRLMLVEVVAQLLDKVQVHLVRPPHGARLQGLLRVGVAALLARAALGGIVLGDGIVRILDRIYRDAAAAALLALAALATSLALRWAEAYHLARILEVEVFHRIHAPWDVHGLQGHVAVDLLEVGREVVGLERGAHQDDLQILHAAIQHRLLDQQQQEVRIHVPLVDLVDDEAANAVQRGLAVQAPQHDRRGGVDQARVLRELVDEADLITHLVPELLLAVPGNVLGERDRGDASRLRADHDLVVGHQVLGVAHELRDERRLAAARVAADDGHDVVADARDDPILLLVGGQLLGSLADLRCHRAPRLHHLRGLRLARHEDGGVRAHA
mmetsp:Transcript_31604/g.80590  ORF Transcript_31604/g.80590 Transcript_31604/m.80590 type:complete len:371 (+) Transcript_31604:1586-2698(+)